MPELPEVETTKNGIQKAITSQKIKKVLVRQPKLRWPIPANLAELITGETLKSVTRRAKYLLLAFEHGTLIMHLGMSGKVRVLQRNIPLQKHDHYEMVFADGARLRYNDPRRFGCLLWCEGDINQHRLLKHLGPEPLARQFNAAYLKQTCSKRKAPIKQVIMDAKVVVGVGNIYACEALFASGVHPLTPANQLSTDQYSDLCKQIKNVLRRSIKVGGTTLKDFAKADGKPGYFQQRLNVYGRVDQACLTCGCLIEKITLGGRGTFYCPECQIR